MAVKRLFGLTSAHRQPNANHQDYLRRICGALQNSSRFELAEAMIRTDLALGRHAARFGGSGAFVRRIQTSAYRQEVAPRLEDLHEGMGASEYGLAMPISKRVRRGRGCLPLALMW